MVVRRVNPPASMVGGSRADPLLRRRVVARDRERDGSGEGSSRSGQRERDGNPKDVAAGSIATAAIGDQPAGSRAPRPLRAEDASAISIDLLRDHRVGSVASRARTDCVPGRRRPRTLASLASRSGLAWHRRASSTTRRESVARRSTDVNPGLVMRTTASPARPASENCPRASASPSIGVAQRSAAIAEEAGRDLGERQSLAVVVRLATQEADAAADVDGDRGAGAVWPSWRAVTAIWPLATAETRPLAATLATRGVARLVARAGGGREISRSTRPRIGLAASGPGSRQASGASMWPA